VQAISHSAQAHKLFILAMTAKNVGDKALVCKRTMHELSVHAHELSIRHRAQAHELLIMAATTTYVGDEILRASARGIYIASCDSDNNNNGDDDNECQQQGLGHKRPAFSYCVAQCR
jgi:hypothetical protein